MWTFDQETRQRQLQKVYPAYKKPVSTGVRENPATESFIPLFVKAFMCVPEDEDAISEYVHSGVL